MSKRTSIRIPDDLYAQLVAQAQRERRTVSNLIVALLADSVTNSDTKPKAALDTASDIRQNAASETGK